MSRRSRINCDKKRPQFDHQGPRTPRRQPKTKRGGFNISAGWASKRPGSTYSDGFGPQTYGHRRRPQIKLPRQIVLKATSQTPPGMEQQICHHSDGKIAIGVLAPMFFGPKIGGHSDDATTNAEKKHYKRFLAASGFGGFLLAKTFPGVSHKFFPLNQPGIEHSLHGPPFNLTEYAENGARFYACGPDWPSFNNNIVML
ncbi:MAG: hypothetical protein CM15mP68_3100 [Pseudomonadota bacterium]|nr:MAG: hypothetical protein CM15mP68_3100 [Pseudomonadota bacterium]